MVCVLLLVALLIPWLLGAGPAGAAEPGGELYIKRGCLGCHGASGRGGVGPALAHTALPLDAFVKQVRQPRGIMPPFPSEAVSEPELHAIHEYLRAVPPPAPRLRADAPKGSLDPKTCAECHRRLLCDRLVSLGAEVLHLRRDAPAEPHRLPPEARLDGGRLVYAAPRQAGLFD